jgi:hypothetical protein
MGKSGIKAKDGRTINWMESGDSDNGSRSRPMRVGESSRDRRWSCGIAMSKWSASAPPQLSKWLGAESRVRPAIMRLGLQVRGPGTLTTDSGCELRQLRSEERDHRNGEREKRAV